MLNNRSITSSNVLVLLVVLVGFGQIAFAHQALPRCSRCRIQLLEFLLASIVHHPRPERIPHHIYGSSESVTTKLERLECWWGERKGNIQQPINCQD